MDQKIGLGRYRHWVSESGRY